LADKPTNEDLESRIKELEKEISENRSATDAIKASEKRFRLVFERSNDAMIVHQLGKILNVNQKACEITGYSREQLLSMSVLDLFPEDFQSEMRSRIKRNVQAGATFFEAKWKRADGKIIDVEVSTNNFDPEKGTRAGIVRDITERKRTEKELRESEEKFRLLAENPVIGVFIHQDEKLLYVNERLADMHGYRPVEIIGKPFHILISPESKEVVLSEVRERRVKEDKEIRQFEMLRIKKNGEKFWSIAVIGGIIYNGRHAFMGSVIDITGRKKAEDALRESEEKFRSITDQSTDLISITDMNGVITYASPASEKLFAVRPGEMVGHHFMEFLDESSIPSAVKKFRESIDKERPTENMELLMKRKDGTTFYGELTGSLYDFASTRGTLVVIRDITERKQAEEEKLALETMLQQAQKMESIGTLAGGIAHDFNNILSPIMVYSEMAMMDLPSGNPIRQNLKSIYKAGERGRDLAKQILTFARRREEERIPLKTSRIVKEAIEFLRSTVPSTIDIHYDCRTEQDIILADPTQMNQIVMNLGTNAAHAMREKGGLLEIVLRDEHIGAGDESGFVGLSPEHYMRLSVRDTGPGISPDIIAKIFEPYFTTKDPGEGTGMGLAVSHGIVKSYEGDIVVESELGKGTTFHILIPVFEADSLQTKEKEITLPGGKERVLIIDDEKAAIDAIQSMLLKLGYSVTSRTSSIEALEAFRHKASTFDLVITDQTMPNMTGKELAGELMLIRPDIPIILCTGFSDQINEAEAKKMGISAFVLKPIVVREMAFTIRNVLDKK
jgi:PAS domain S-box-containing protein